MLPQNRNKSTKPSVLQQMTGMDVASSLHPLANLESQNKNNMTYIYKMDKNNLSKLTKNQLIELLIAKQKPVPMPRTKKVKPIPYPRKSVKQMVKDYENTIIKPPMQFRDRPIVQPRNNIIPPPIQFADKPKVSFDNQLIPRRPVPLPRKKKMAPIPRQRTQITEVARAFKGYNKSYEVGIKNETDPLIQMSSTRLAIAHFMKQLLTQMKGIKFIETLTIYFEQQKGNQTVSRIGYFNSKPKTITNANDFQESLDVNVEQIMNDIHKWISEGSAWIIKSINGHYINIIKYEPLTGSSYIKLPTELQHHKSGLINLKNKDNECFRWCHIRHLNPRENNPQRIKKTDKAFLPQLNYQGIEFPVSVKQYNKIEIQNSININVFGYENKQTYPIYVSKEKFENVMNLLLISEDENKHYCLIKDFNRFMYRKTRNKNKKHFCMHCLQCFSKEEILLKHKEVCIEINGVQSIKMPEVGSKIEFKNFNKQMQAPFVIYADFEAITEPIHGCNQSNQQSFTEAYQKHTDCGYGYKVVCCYDDKYSKPIKYYRGEKAVYKFMQAMLDEVKYCRQTIKYKFNKPLVMSPEDEDKFQKSTSCHICGKKYEPNDRRVRDHCHITGKFRGSAHNQCNRDFTITNKIPVIFHNLKGYDSHFIMQEIGKIIETNTYVDKKGETRQHKINVIPNNMEQYMAFMLGYNLVFIDSLQFMNQSLANLVKNLPEDAFKYTSEVFKGRKLQLMKQKGVYPYDYMSNFDKFNDTQLPTKDEFYSQMNNTNITNEEYSHAQNVWNTFQLKTMGEYHDLYLKSDVLLLADVFENFRKTCLEYYRLDPCHYFTSPGLSWDAMLKMTEVQLELITDIDMYQFVEKGMRGGISYIANRYGKANNKYMQNWNPNEPSKHIMYLDANNLYGWAMSQHLPTGNFKWLNKQQIKNINWKTIPKDNKTGYLLEVDLEYPHELHDLHNDYPCGAEQIKVAPNMLSDYCQRIAEKFGITSGQVKKLIPTLANKSKYVLHYRNLQLYRELGLKLTKIHRVLSFNQSPWLKAYIDFNTRQRTNAKNAFEKDFFKLMNNSVFGKTMENIRKREDIKLVTNEKQLLKMTSKPTFINSKIFNENLVAVHKIKECLTLNRPAYVGMCILDLSKTLMYDFHYNFVKNKYGNKAKLLFTDTDSLTYEIEAEDVYQDFWNKKEMFDNSDYPSNHQFYDSTNKKVIGKFKDEAAGVPITEFVGLRSKMYSYIKDNNNGGKTAKGIKKNVIKNDIQHFDYKDVLFNEKQLFHQMKTIRSNHHELGSYTINKTSLSCFDDKRYLYPDGIHSLAYGHYAIQ